MSPHVRVSPLLLCIVALAWWLAPPALAMPGGMGGIFSAGVFAFMGLMFVMGIGFVWAWFVSLYNVLFEERKLEWGVFLVILTVLGAFLLVGLFAMTH